MGYGGNLEPTPFATLHIFATLQIFADLCFDSLVITLFLLQTNAYVNAASYCQYRQKYSLKIDLDSELWVLHGDYA